MTMLSFQFGIGLLVRLVSCLKIGEERRLNSVKLANFRRRKRANSRALAVFRKIMIGCTGLMLKPPKN